MTIGRRKAGALLIALSVALGSVTALLAALGGVRPSCPYPPEWAWGEHPGHPYSLSVRPESIRISYTDDAGHTSIWDAEDWIRSSSGPGGPWRSIPLSLPGRHIETLHARSGHTLYIAYSSDGSGCLLSLTATETDSAGRVVMKAEWDRNAPEVGHGVRPIIGNITQDAGRILDIPLKKSYVSL